MFFIESGPFNRRTDSVNIPTIQSLGKMYESSYKNFKARAR